VETDLITTEELRQNNPRAYFQETLEVSEFKKLKELVTNTNSVVSRELLIEEWVVKLEWNKIEWIYWKWDLDLILTNSKKLRKIKKIEWDLKCWWLATLEDLWELEEVWWKLDISRTSLKTLWKLRKVWRYIDCNNADNLKDLWDLEEVLWYCDLRWTKIDNLWKLKKVSGEIDCNYLTTLESLWDLEEVLNLDLNRTKVKKLWKLKKVKWNLYCRNIKTLENLWELKEVEWDFYVKGITVELQIEIMKLYQEGKLKIGWLIYFWWNLEWVEKLLEQETIPWSLDISQTRYKTLWKLKKVKWMLNCSTMALKDLWELEEVERDFDVRENSLTLQIYVLYQEKKKKIKVGRLLVDDMLWKFFDKIYHNWVLDTRKFELIFGKDISKIEEIRMRDIATEILLREYKGTSKDIEERIEQIIKKNRSKKLTGQQKKSIKGEILKLDRELMSKKEILERFRV